MEVYATRSACTRFGKGVVHARAATGYIAFGPALRGRAEALLRSERALRSTGFCAPTALMQRLVTELADLSPDYEALRQDQLVLRETLTRLGYDAVPGQATAFVYVRCPDGFDDWTFVETAGTRRTAAMPSSLFHEPGYFRLALNVGPDRLDEVGHRLAPP